MSQEHLISQTFPELDKKKIDSLLQYSYLLRDWNDKINLVSRKDIDNIIRRHIIPCLALARIGKFSSADRILDIGTGGGLPGIPLAIVHGTSDFTLIDSVGKKIMAVSDIASALGLKNIKTINGRAENLSEKFNKIVGRAVTNLNDFIKFSEKLLISPGKIFYIRGADYSEDFKLSNADKVYNVGELIGMAELADKVILEIVK